MPLPERREGFRKIFVASQETGLADTKQVDSSEGEITMRIGNRRFPFTSSSLLIAAVVASFPCFGAASAEVHGTVFDPLGAVVPRALVELSCDSAVLSQTITDESGVFVFASIKPGRCRVRATATGFTADETQPIYVGKGGISQVKLVLKLGNVAQQLVVSATGSPIPLSQVGASVSTIARENIEGRLDLSDALRTVPGIQVLQTGQRGGTTDIFVRGGNPDANKVLLDGIPINDIGGRVEFGNLETAGIKEIEVLRGPNSVLYGADALAGVINLTTRVGTTRLPQVAIAVDGGNFGTRLQEISLGGAHRQLDYFSNVSRFDTGNSEPNSAFHNATYAGNIGWSLSAATQIRFTLRHTATALGLPGALDVYGIADDSFQKEQDTYLGATAQNQTTSSWHNLLRYGGARLDSEFVNPTPTGAPFDDFGSGPNFLGNTVTLSGANGFATSGRAILDFGGNYPQLFNAEAKRDFIYSQSDYRFNRNISGLVAFRYENESGSTSFADIETPTRRKAFDYTAQLEGSFWDRLYALAGIGIDKNTIFGVAPTPRISLAYYVVPLRSSHFLNGTKLKFSFGKGIKEPAIFSESTSLFVLLSGLPNGTQLVSRFHVKPIGAERSRSFEIGIDEIAGNGKAKLGLTIFHNEFFDQIEFVDNTALPQVGVPLAVQVATPFGASVNSGAFRVQGAEAEVELNLGHGFNLTGGYTYLDSVVQRSFAGSALSPSFNPAFPTIPIGNSPLVGARPFRRAPHSASFQFGYSQARLMLSLNGTLVGRRDDSTHAMDPFFGNTMLLPNRDLGAGYQKIDLRGKLHVNSAVELYTSLENILTQHYDAAFGFPSLPFTLRVGMKFTIGGESWKIR